MRMTEPKELRMNFDPEVRQKRQFDEARRLHAERCWAPPSGSGKRIVWSKLDTSSLDGLKKSQEPLRQSLPRRNHRQAARADDAAQPAHAADLRRAEVEGLRGRARPLRGRHRLRHPAGAQGPQARREAARRRLPARARRPADGRRAIPRRRRRTTTPSAPSWPTAASSSSRRRTRTSSRTSSASSSARPTRSA